MIAVNTNSQTFSIRRYNSTEHLPREEQLAWKIALLAKHAPRPSIDVETMVQNRIIDNAGVSVASLFRPPVGVARDQAIAHTPSESGKGANIVGLDPNKRFSPEWAAWANGVAVRELDFHDTFLAADYSHPGDNIPALIAVAQHLGVGGARLAAAISVSYEVQTALVKGICLHEHKIDHIAHLGPSVVAGLATLLELEPNVAYHAIGQALHTTTATRQSRKGEISTWKAFAPAFAGKVAIESVDRAMRGETSPSPIWEGEDGIIGWLLGGPDARYAVELPAPGDACEGILETYTKEHSAEYQAQALIDLARSMATDHPEIADPNLVDSILIRTSHHTHYVIGSGSGDPQKYSPKATRETLDHSIPYIFAVALQDRAWHHVHSYTPERAQRPDTVALWQKVRTTEDPVWTSRYHSTDPKVKAFGGQVEVTLRDGTAFHGEMSVANAHPLGAAPFSADEYESKFRSLAEPTINSDETARFISIVRRLGDLEPTEVGELTVSAGISTQRKTEGIF